MAFLTHADSKALTYLVTLQECRRQI